jgi:hypothetical protein
VEDDHGEAFQADELFALAAVPRLGTVPCLAQQLTGVGAPDTTTTINGAQLPAPPQKFESKIGRNVE